MTLEQKLRKKQYDQVWQWYCGFLDLSLPEFMEIQNRLMLEQLELYAGCELGRRIMKGKKPASVSEFRRVVPLTSYEDYADILLPKVDSALPAKPVLWIETTWEGGKRPVKVAPYTESMLKSHKANTIACMILATSNKKGHFTLRGGENFLYGMAQLPYLTGLVPHLILSELWVNFMPPTKEAAAMRFSQRNKVGFQMGLQSGVDLFFGMSSVIAKISDTFTLSGGSGENFNIFKVTPKMFYRLLKAWMNSKQKKVPIKPKDIWTLKGLICAGTDTANLKKKIENYWGIRPLEIFGGTEPTCIATETWSKDGLVLFPDVCFYEFIPMSELEKNIDDPSYVPHTYLLDELVAGNEYELVISSFKGGAFARYRMGDIFRCLSLSKEEDGINLPHFAYVDRHPSVIDLAGFTRITEGTISEALTLSKLDIAEWFAVKEFDEGNRAFLHLYVEVGFGGLHSAVTKDIIKEHLSIYFRYVDTDYNDLKHLLGIDPLVISIIPAGTISRFSDTFGRNLRKMNPSHFDVIEVLKIARGESGKGVLMPFLEIFFWAVPIISLASYCILMLFLSLSKKDKFIRVFMLVLAALILWTASSLFMALQLYPGVLFWDRAMVMGMIAVPFLLYYFISVFTNSLNLFQIVFWGILSGAAMVSNLLGYVVIDASVITTTVTYYEKQYTSTEYYYVLGMAAIPMYIFTSILISSIIIKARNNVREGKTTYGRVGPIMAGISILFIGVLLNVFSAVGKYPVDILACFINAVLIMYAIYKHRMLELRLMVTKGIVYSVFAILLTCVYVYTVFSVERGIGNSYQNITPYFVTLSALLVAVVFQPLYRFVYKLIDKMFYKAEYPKRQALKNFSVSISNKLDLQDMAAELIEAVQLAIHAKEILLMLKNEEKRHYYIFSTSSQIFKPDFVISFDNPVVKWLISNNTSLLREELYFHPTLKSMWDEERKVVSDLEIEVIVPIKSRNDLIGILLLTGKSNRTAYTLDDLDLLTYLGVSSAVAFDNARLFSRAQSDALTDSLTNLYNHRYFRKALLEQVKKTGSAELSLLLLDLDMFKLYNDLYGHWEGDKALVKVASIMSGLVGQKGIVCRYGGEEFTIILPYFDAKRAFDIAEKIRLEIQRTFFNTTDVTQRFLTASVGVCTYPHAAANAEELMKRADLALYTAKNNGKNQTVVYTPHFDSSSGAEINDSSSTVRPVNTATIYALTAAIDAKDHYTFGHSQRVAEYATALAGALGLDKSYLEIIKEAALLHDVGKIGIPENILTKAGRLTMEEYEIVKKHVEMSITIIKHLPSMNHVIPAVIGHHERWDGKGYPRGLKGENIPLLARCLTVTDAFDALISDRQYRAGSSVISALNEIENHSGTQFDPVMANLFIKLVREGAVDIDRDRKMRNAL